MEIKEIVKFNATTRFSCAFENEDGTTCHFNTHKHLEIAIHALKHKNKTGVVQQIGERLWKGPWKVKGTKHQCKICNQTFTDKKIFLPYFTNHCMTKMVDENGDETDELAKNEQHEHFVDVPVVKRMMTECGINPEPRQVNYLLCFMILISVYL